MTRQKLVLFLIISCSIYDQAKASSFIICSVVVLPKQNNYVVFVTRQKLHLFYNISCSICDQAKATVLLINVL